MFKSIFIQFSFCENNLQKLNINNFVGLVVQIGRFENFEQISISHFI